MQLSRTLTGRVVTTLAALTFAACGTSERATGPNLPPPPPDNPQLTRASFVFHVNTRNGAIQIEAPQGTVNPGPFVDGKAPGISGDTYFAVIEFSNPVHAEALLSYGNWSKVGSPHVEDQMRLLSKKEMRPVWRTRKEVEANLESRRTF